MRLGLGLGLGLGSSGGTGSGATFDASLTPPVISLAVAGNVYPPEIDVIIDDTAQADTNGFELWYSDTVDFASYTSVIHDPITNAEALADAFTVSGLSSISSPAVTYFKGRITSAGLPSDWGNIILHGDIVAPTVTSSATPSGAELAPMAYSVTADKAIASVTVPSGADASLLEVSGTTVRLVGNANLDYETKSSYAFTVRVYSYNGLFGELAVTFTVNDINENPTGLSGFFTDVTGATVSTLYTSANTYTVAGLATTVPITITGGSYSKNGAGYTSGAGTVQNGDTVQLQTTSSASAGAFQYVVVNIGGGTDTWSVKTAGTPALPTGAVFQFEADDLTTLFQNIAGSTAVTTSGQTVGKWNDKSGNGNNVAAAADDGTRPLYDLTSGISSVVADGTDDVLFKTAALNLWSAGAWTIVFAVKSSTAGGRTLIGEGNSGNATPFASYARSLAATSTSFANSLRNDANTNLSDPTVTLQTGVFDGTYHVIVLGDDGSGWTVWLDGVKGSKIVSGYVRSGSLTLDRFSLFARVRPAISEYFGGNLQFACGYTRFLSDADASAASTYAGAKQGRTI